MIRDHSWKMHGLGNDFVVFDARSANHCYWIWRPTSCGALADRRTGIGCDQLIIVDRSETAPAPMSARASGIAMARKSRPAAMAAAPLRHWLAVTPASKPLGGRLIANASGRWRQPGSTWACRALRLGRDVPLAYAMDTQPAAIGLGRTRWRIRARSALAIRMWCSFVGDPAKRWHLGTGWGPVIEHDPVFPERVNVGVAVAAGAQSHDPAGLGTRRRADPRLWYRRGCRRCRGATASALPMPSVTVTLPGGDLRYLSATTAAIC